jgi:hypothetical protein
MTLAEILARLRDFDEAPLDGQAPAIYAAEPWGATSAAVVEWSNEKGGIPAGRQPLLFYLATVREALQFFGADYDARVANGEVEAMCAKIGHHIAQKNAQRLRRIE